MLLVISAGGCKQQKNLSHCFAEKEHLYHNLLSVRMEVAFFPGLISYVVVPPIPLQGIMNACVMVKCFIYVMVWSSSTLKTMLS